MDEIVLQNSEIRAVFSPGAGAVLRSLRALTDRGEIELLAGGEGPHDPAVAERGTGVPIMAPWPNRIRDGRLIVDGATFQLPLDWPPHAIHGTVSDVRFAASITAGDDASAATACRMSAELEQPWPFRGSVHMDAALDGPSLVQTLTVEAAESERRFPAGFGWHPWFRRNLAGGDVSIRASVRKVWVVEDDTTATGETEDPSGPADLRPGRTPEIGSLDTCFSIEPESAVELKWPEITLTLTSSRALSHLVVFTPERAVCVEPQTCAMDAFRLQREGISGTGTVFVSPGNPLTGRTVWTWS